MASILVVDDDANMGGMLTLLLEYEGYSASFVDHVADAKKAIAVNEPDLVITDLELDGENGLELLQWVASSHRGTRTILMSGAVGQELAVTADASGAHAWLSKPFEVTSLRSVVRGLLERDCRAAA